jgi:hypothetical protein
MTVLTTPLKNISPVSSVADKQSDTLSPEDSVHNITPSALDIFSDVYLCLAPGVIRARDAAFYLGMNRNYFRDHVKPYLGTIPIGAHGKGFDRLDLDRWIMYAKTVLGTPPEKTPPWENLEVNLPALAEKKKQTAESTAAAFKPGFHKKPSPRDLEKVIAVMASPPASG